ncbi:hypothetical protein G7Y79_00003g009900 [Physcia stellaris]|nr:hypothetical protein G7Y79_00003g009900 [Physcia stellaris]
MAPVQPAAQHVPAWKRLGLKLKYAKDAPDTTATSDTVHDAEAIKKRKFVDGKAVEGLELITPTKKAKKPKKIDVDARNGSVNGSDQKDHDSATIYSAEASSHSPFPSAAPPAKTATLTKRKSVTFAPEAKTTDGDSTKDLYDRWLETQSTADASFDPKKAAPALTIHSPLPKPSTSITPKSVSEEAEDPKIKTKPKKKKKKRKSKSTTIKPNQSLTSSPKNSSKPSAESTNGEPHPALQYLTAHHTTPNTWKFSKNHQTYLLKHLFSLSALPASYNPALGSYLSGLQGRSARQKIREAALKVREADEMWLSEVLAKGREPEWEKKRRRDEYEAAWKAEKETLEEVEGAREWEEGKKDFEWRLKKRRRAEEVLRAVGEAETLIPEAPKASESKATVNGNLTADAKQVNGGINVNEGPKQPARKKRKRKRRTTGVPDDESSSSSSSSSDSDSDGETLTEQRLREALQPNKAQKIEELRKALHSGKRTPQSTPSSGLGGSVTDKHVDESSSGGSSGESGSSSSSSENSEDDAEEDNESGGGSDSSDEDNEDESTSSSGSD